MNGFTRRWWRGAGLTTIGWCGCWRRRILENINWKENGFPEILLMPRLMDNIKDERGCIQLQPSIILLSSLSSRRHCRPIFSLLGLRPPLLLLHRRIADADADDDDDFKNIRDRRSSSFNHSRIFSIPLSSNPSDFRWPETAPRSGQSEVISCREQVLIKICRSHNARLPGNNF